MIYFASDFHLGLPDFKAALYREKIIIEWLDSIKNNAEDIFFVGDVFEFWYEWKYVIPKHFSRFFGKVAELSDLGINLHFFTGNHDLWAYKYLNEEFNIRIYQKPEIFYFNSKKFYLAHGDGLGPGDKAYKIMKKFFQNKFLQWCFSNLLHPDLAFKLALKVSYQRDSLNKKPSFKGKDEWLIQYADEINKKENHDFYIFGHRHIPVEFDLDNKSKVIFLGDWIKIFSYAVFDGQNTTLKFWEK